MSAYKVLDYPHLGMRLDLNAVYTKAELEARCGRNHPERRRKLHEKLANKLLFKPVTLRSALRRVMKATKSKQKWVRPPVLLKEDEVGRHRLIADGIAADILRQADADKSVVKDEDVLMVLRSWGFYVNKLRRNVIPDGEDGVFSDTLGLTRSRDGRTLMSSLSRRYPNVTRLLMRWFQTYKPKELDTDFPVTSISVNSSYAAKRHRDKNNVGPSVLRAFGSFRGGTLRYWPRDSGHGKVEDLSPKDSKVLNVRTAALFDGRRAHEVMAFQGRERFSLVFFTVGKYWVANAQARKICTKMGFCFPTPASVKRANAQVAMQ